MRKHGQGPYRLSFCMAARGPGGAGEMEPVAQELVKYVSVLEPFQTARSVEGQIGELKTH
ncbi:MAG TPA: hypothetical protein DDY49_08765 [Paenibacillaceae bacterium]|nr:hypothetical protein [Paenibacillaceae bacterium]